MKAWMNYRLTVITILLASVFAGLSIASAEPPPTIDIREHLGRPMVFIDGEPRPLPMYSTLGHWNKELFEKATPRFFPHRMAVYFLEVPMAKLESYDFFANPFWVGDTIKPEPMTECNTPLDYQAKFILDHDPDAMLMIRMWNHEPQSWRDLHPEDLFVDEEGNVHPAPSLASDRFWKDCGRCTDAVIRYCESRPWGNHILGYANFLRLEGSHEPVINNWFFDHGSLMTARWRAYLKEKYNTVEALRKAYGDPSLTFENVPVPKDQLRGRVADVSSLLYWQDAEANQPLRDYLALGAELFRGGFARIATAAHGATEHRRIFLYDGFKQKMMGWANLGFFADNESWPLAFTDSQSGSGAIGVTPLFDAPGFDGLITPHRYEARGPGGVFEPEGVFDSMVLRGKLAFAEMDVRTYTGQSYTAPARNDKEFAALTWRDLAGALTRGFNCYWMDLNEDWFATEGMHKIIARQVEVIKESVDWPHGDVPCIAMILDDASVMETNGNGSYLNLAVMWEQLSGLAHCGVPFRIYMLEDLKLANFPEHRVFYFPNLFKVDDAKLALLNAKVFRNGNVVLWGPGSGISDGETVSAAHASRLTGFHFELQPINYPRRVQIQQFDHPITSGMDEGQLLGDSLPYGPVLFPTDGETLGMAWTKQGRNEVGLAVKTFGKGARGSATASQKLGEGDWASVFTTAVPVPANLWRGLARFGGVHVYCPSNDVLLADSTIVALHSIRSGHKVINLPGPSRVFDVITGKLVSERAEKIEFEFDAADTPGTRVFRLEPR